MIDPVGTACPKCGARAVPMVFGYPGSEMRVAARAKLIRLGGCYVRDDGSDPNWACLGWRGHKWLSAEGRDEAWEAALRVAFAGVGE